MLGLAFANLNIFYKKSLHPHFFITTLGGGIYMEKNIKLFKLYSLLTGKFFVGTTQVFVVSIMFTDVKKTVNEEQKLINYFKLSMSAIKDNKRLRLQWYFQSHIAV